MEFADRGAGGVFEGGGGDSAGVDDFVFCEQHAVHGDYDVLCVHHRAGAGVDSGVFLSPDV